MTYLVLYFQKPRSGGLSSTFINLIQVLTTLFTHLVTSEAVEAVVIFLSASLGRFYEVTGKKHRRGILQNTITKVNTGALHFIIVL